MINDTVDGVPIVVMWGAAHTADALDGSVMADSRAIGTGVAFMARAGGETLTFTVAGEDLFTDDQTASTWNLLGQAVRGPLEGNPTGVCPPPQRVLVRLVCLFRDHRPVVGSFLKDSFWSESPPTN